MEKRKINKKLWADFLSTYVTSGVEGKISKKIMLMAIMAVLLLNAATICYIAICNQSQGVEMAEELMQMLLLLIFSSGVVGFGMIKKSDYDSDKKEDSNTIDNKKGEK